MLARDNLEADGAMVEVGVGHLVARVEELDEEAADGPDVGLVGDMVLLLLQLFGRHAEDGAPLAARRLRYAHSLTETQDKTFPE